MTIRPKPDWTKKRGEKYRACYWCDNFRKRGVIRFDDGGPEVQVGETITGATSGDTGVVTEVTRYGGAWADGDAVGVIEMSDVTGANSDGDIFTDNESVDGSVSGYAVIRVNGTGAVQGHGLLFPKRDLIKYRGRWHCRWHFDWYVKRAIWDLENRINLAELEKDRGKE